MSLTTSSKDAGPRSQNWTENEEWVLVKEYSARCVPGLSGVVCLKYLFSDLLRQCQVNLTSCGRFLVISREAGERAKRMSAPPKAESAKRVRFEIRVKFTFVGPFVRNAFFCLA